MTKRVLEKSIMDEMEGVTPPQDTFLDAVKENLAAEGVAEWTERCLSPTDFTDGWLTRNPLPLPLLKEQDTVETPTDRVLKTPSPPQNTPSNSNDCNISFVPVPANSKIVKHKGFMIATGQLEKEVE